jgi:hypothetical protein
VSDHMPVRNWYHNCVRGRGREADHMHRAGDQEQGISEYHMDNCFPCDDKNHMTVLVAAEEYIHATRQSERPRDPMEGLECRGVAERREPEHRETEEALCEITR